MLVWCFYFSCIRRYCNGCFKLFSSKYCWRSMLCVDECSLFWNDNYSDTRHGFLHAACVWSVPHSEMIITPTQLCNFADLRRTEPHSEMLTTPTQPCNFADLCRIEPHSEMLIRHNPPQLQGRVGCPRSEQTFLIWWGWATKIIRQAKNHPKT